MKQPDTADVFAYMLHVVGRDLPEPEREYVFAPPRKWRADFCWPAQKVVVEVDGGLYTLHGGRHNTDADREKCNTAASLGYLILHFSPRQLRDDPGSCMALVRMALNARSKT